MGNPVDLAEYTVAWICSQDVVHTAILIMLDGEHGSIPGPPRTAYPYILGSVVGLRVVIAMLRDSDADASLIAHMRSIFPRLEAAVIVNTGDDMNVVTGNERVRWGDVVIRTPTTITPSLETAVNGVDGVQIRDLLMNAVASLDDNGGVAAWEHIKRISTRAPFLKHIYRNPNVDDSDCKPNIIVLQHKIENSLLKDLGAKGLVVVEGISNVQLSDNSDICLGYPAAAAAAVVRHLSLYMSNSAQPEPEAEVTANYQRVAWLTPTDFSLHQAEHIKQRLPGTCLWILASQEYQAWLVKPTHHTLSCTGKPGAGKTIAVSTVIQDLEARFHRDMTIGLAYVYFSASRPVEQDLQNILLCLMKQLVQDLPDVPEPVTGLARILKSAVRISHVLEALFRTVEQFSRVYLVLDAVDELSAGTRRKLLREMSRLQMKAGVKIFLTWEHDSEGIDRLKNVDNLEIHAQAQDLYRYVDQNISCSPPSVRAVLGEARDQFVSRVVARSHAR